MAATITKTKANQEASQEAKLAKARNEREEAVRKFVKQKNQRSGVKIVVVNVYGDAYRVNYYAEVVGGENMAIKIFRIVDSEFIRWSQKPNNGG